MERIRLLTFDSEFAEFRLMAIVFDDNLSPFPALTPGQRLYLDINGYVVIENTLTTDEGNRLRDAIYELRQKFFDVDDPIKHSIGTCRSSTDKCDKYYASFHRILDADDRFLEHFTHPLIVSLMEEAVGGKVLLEEAAVIVNSRDPDVDPNKPFRYGFHRGGQPGFDSYILDSLYHCTFTRTLTNLTDIGPDDGGTALIAGSHKLSCNENEMVAAAYENPALIHHVEAPAGSTLIMYETTIHSTSLIRSDRERVMILGSYTHPKHQVQGGPWSEDIITKVPEKLRELVGGRPYWTWPERHRKLGDAPNKENVPYVARMWSVYDES